MALPVTVATPGPVAVVLVVSVPSVVLVESVASAASVTGDKVVQLGWAAMVVVPVTVAQAVTAPTFAPGRTLLSI